MSTVSISLKEEAHQLIDSLPSNATWDDVYYAIYVRLAIENGVKDLDEGRKVSDEEVRKRFGLRP
jgi:predicted DNA-binding protein